MTSVERKKVELSDQNGENLENELRKESMLERMKEVAVKGWVPRMTDAKCLKDSE